MPDPGPQYYLPPTKDEKFLAGLDKAIEFHRTNPNDPHGISAAVLCSLTEVREAFAAANGYPLLKR